MAEMTIWSGNPSQWKNFGSFLFAAVITIAIATVSIFATRSASAESRRLGPFMLIFLLLPIFMALTRYLQTKNRIYELTTERLKTSEGVFNRVTDTLELYRVKDLETRQPFLYRVAGIENIQLNTSDASSPVALISAIPSSVGLPDKIRNQVEGIRAQKGVREIDVE